VSDDQPVNRTNDGEHVAPRHVLFVTGKLAEPALRRVLADMAPPFAADVAVLGITVAALMTTDWIARHLASLPDGVDLRCFIALPQTAG